ncbi:MAG: pilus assembly protein [Caulobacteraceae bacterium]|nr:pilus assembly protein [Caulobacteraceae bacterium]
MRRGLARGTLTWLQQRLGAFRTDERGNIALMFALCGPAVILLSVGAIDLAHVQSSRVRLQDVADTAALAGANELGLAINEKAAIERAEAFVRGHVAEWDGAPEIQTDVTVFSRDGQRVIQVVLKGHNPSFFANLLPPGGWNYEAQARAVAVGLTPLCVLVSGDAGSKLLNIKDSGRISAPKCLVHSNRDILVEGGSLEAYQVQAVTSARGIISPDPGTGARPIDDPFKTLSLKEQSPCPLVDIAVPDVLTGTFHLAPGVHCGQFKMAGDSVLVLDPGEHWFLEGKLEMKGNSRLEGNDVVLFFDKKSKFDFKDHSTVNLDGRKRGAWAGMVMVAARGNTQDFGISSDHVESLLGVIYVPDAQLIVEGGKADIARDSAWTVIVARSLQLKGAPSLIINANYASTDVPVPTGVGPRDGGSQLVQ